MNTKNVKSSPLPAILGELSHSNQFFKMISLCSLFLVIMSFFFIYHLMNKEPLVLTLNSEGRNLERTKIPKVEDLIKEGINQYLGKRYSWAPSDIQQKMKDSTFFVGPSSQKAFYEAMTNVTRFSLEKQVAQKIYPANIEINLKEGTASITGDRITTIQGLKAAGNLKLQLTFESGPKTVQNPWGVYIVKEREEQ